MISINNEVIIDFRNCTSSCFNMFWLLLRISMQALNESDLKTLKIWENELWTYFNKTFCDSDINLGKRNFITHYSVKLTVFYSLWHYKQKLKSNIQLPFSLQIRRDSFEFVGVDRMVNRFRNVEVLTSWQPLFSNSNRFSDVKYIF